MVTPSVLFLTVESTRADRTSFLGDADTTPELVRMAQEPSGMWFQNCFANSMKTAPSSASLLTGTYPATHRMGLVATASERLSTDLRTLPELLSATGYRTACFSTNAYLSPANGLDRGFDEFSWLKKRKENFLPTSEHFRSFLKYALNVHRYGPGLNADGRKHNLTYAQTDIMKRWLTDAATDDAPFFCYGHIQNPHLPYTPPRKYLDRFLRDTSLSADEAIELSLDLFKSNASKKRCIAEGLDLSDDEMDALVGLYEAEIAYADACIGSLFDHITDLPGETIVVVTADHGELFGEYGLIGHNLVLHDGVTHVPLVTHGLDVEHDGDGLVQHVDLTRTIAAVAGCDHEQFVGTDIRSGTRGYVVSQRGVDNLGAYTQHNPDFDTSRFYEQCLNCVRTETFKYLTSVEGRQLYRLPDETADCLGAFPEVADRLDTVVKRVGDCCTAVGEATDEAAFTDEMHQQLRDLGYL